MVGCHQAPLVCIQYQSMHGKGRRAETRRQWQYIQAGPYARKAQAMLVTSDANSFQSRIRYDGLHCGTGPHICSSSSTTTAVCRWAKSCYMTREKVSRPSNPEVQGPKRDNAHHFSFSSSDCHTTHKQGGKCTYIASTLVSSTPPMYILLKASQGQNQGLLHSCKYNQQPLSYPVNKNLLQPLTMASSVLNRNAASAFASSVLPTPVGPRNMKLAMGPLGSLRSALLRWIAVATAATASF